MKLVLTLLALTPLISLATPYELARQKISPSFDKKLCGPKVKVAMFDADSTLRISPRGKLSANHAVDVHILPGVENALAELNQMGYLVAVFSNQGGVAGGYFDFDYDPAIPKDPDQWTPEQRAIRYIDALAIADQALVFMAGKIRRLNREAIIHYFDFADADKEWEANNEFSDNVVYTDSDGVEHLVRKPGSGMGIRLEEQLQEFCGIPNLVIDRDESFMVGDSAFKEKGGQPWHFSNSDRGFAEAFFGATFTDGETFFGKSPNRGNFYEPYQFFGWDPSTISNGRGLPVFERQNLMDYWRAITQP